MSINISVVIPVFKPDLVYFKIALESVLAQTGLDHLEIFVIDDSPNDSVEAFIATNYANRVIYVRGRRTGLSDALNDGFALSKFQYAARMDADDLCAPNRLRSQVEFMRKSNVQVCGSNTAFIGAAWGVQHFPPTDGDIKFGLAFGCPISHPSVVLDREALGKDLAYTSGSSVSEDYELWTKLAKLGFRFANIQQPLIRYRIHKSQATQTRKDVMVRTSESMRRSYCAFYFQDSALLKFLDDNRYQNLDFADSPEFVEFMHLYFEEAAARHVDGASAFRVLYPILMKQPFFSASLFKKAVGLMRGHGLLVRNADYWIAEIRAMFGLHSNAPQIKALKKWFKYNNNQ